MNDKKNMKYLQKGHNRGESQCLGDELEGLHDVEGGSGVQAVGDRVQEFDLSGRQKHLAQRDAAFLPTTHTADHTVTDKRVGGLAEAQNLQHVV